MTQFDADAKKRVQEALRSRAEAEVASAHDTVEGEQDAAELRDDGTGSIRVDDVSQSDEAGEMARLYEEVQASTKQSLEAVEALDFSPTDTVRAGAIVAFGGQHYVVGLVSDVIEVDGVSFEGISADSPVYGAIEGKQAGESFTFNGHDQRLDVVA